MSAGTDGGTLDSSAGFDPRITPRQWLATSARDPVQGKLTLGGDGGGVFDLDSRGGGVTLTVTRGTTAGPPADQVTDVLAGRPPAAAVLGDLPASTRTAVSRLADFFNTPAGQSPA